MTSDITHSETVGERLRRLRLERGLSQRELSAPGVSYAYISRIEAGARRPSVKALRMLALKLGVSAEYLETGSEASGAEVRELRLAEAELRLRLTGEAPLDELVSILEDAVAHADEAAAVRARIALGFAASSRGDHPEAIRYLEDAIGTEFVTPLSRPDVYATLGRTYAAHGQPRQAVSLFERGLDFVEAAAPDDFAARVRFSTYLSYALTDLGELERAKEVVELTLRGSEERADPYTRVRLYWSLGRISQEQAKPLVALEHFRRAAALLEATEDTLHLARAHLSCAGASIASGDDFDAAAFHLAEAERLLGPHPDPDDMTVVRRMQATRAARAGEYAAATGYAREALALAQELPNERGQAWWALAEALAGADDPGAEDAYREAVGLLDKHGTLREQAQVLRSYGRFLHDAGRDREAFEALERATGIAAAFEAEAALTR